MKQLKYLTIEEQIALLKEKGLIIQNDKTAKKYLTEIGYYKLINGYKTPFKYVKTNSDQTKEKHFIENTRIEDLYHLYSFDSDLRSLLFKYLSEIEIMVKTKMSDVISSQYGIDENIYLNQNNFKPDKNSKKSDDVKFSEIKNTILKAINKQSTKHSAIKWYSQQYGYCPFWVVSNILTFGTISLLYSKMTQPDQYKISHSFGQQAKMFESMLQVMQLFRNVCAHNEVVYNYKTFKSLSHKGIEEIYELYNISIDPRSGKFMFGTNDVFALVIIFKLILSKSQYNEFISKLKSLLLTLKRKVDDAMYNGLLLAMGIVGDLDLILKYSKK